MHFYPSAIKAVGYSGHPRRAVGWVSGLAVQMLMIPHVYDTNLEVKFDSE